jgi:hypothetical protein
MKMNVVQSPIIYAVALERLPKAFVFIRSRARRILARGKFIKFIIRPCVKSNPLSHTGVPFQKCTVRSLSSSGISDSKIRDLLVDFLLTQTLLM